MHIYVINRITFSYIKLYKILINILKDGHKAPQTKPILIDLVNLDFFYINNLYFI
jgi:hypothetical protein